jgi:hypothetical protein
MRWEKECEQFDNQQKKKSWIITIKEQIEFSQRY